jgi:hypothetical protein
MNKFYKCLIFLVILTLITVIPIIIFANSAEPPSLIILINNPPEDLSIVMISNEEQPEAMVRRVAWEGYYVFYSSQMQSDGEYTFKVTSNGKSFECTFTKPIKRYNEILTLDLSSQKLSYGKYPFRSVLLVSMRLLLTLLIEGIVFWLFGFREKGSWLIFLIINLITQGGLNIWLNSEASSMSTYLILTLIIGEFFVFLVEIIGFENLIREKKRKVILGYVLLANLISLIAGGYMISILPV